MPSFVCCGLCAHLGSFCPPLTHSGPHAFSQEVALQCQDAELNGHLHLAARAMEDLDGDTVFTTEKYQYKQPKTKEKSTSKDSEKAEVPHQLQALRQILLLVRTHQCFSHLFSCRVCLFGLQ